MNFLKEQAKLDKLAISNTKKANKVIGALRAQLKTETFEPSRVRLKREIKENVSRLKFVNKCGYKF